MPAVPSIVINECVAFDNIPDMEALSEAVRKAIDHKKIRQLKGAFLAELTPLVTKDVVSKLSLENLSAARTF